MNIRALLLIRPKHFGYNTETADSNTFQNKPDAETALSAQEALREFDACMAQLARHGIPFTVIEDLDQPPLPDSVFPNNWISTHADGKMAIYPMFTANRRAEVRDDIMEKLKSSYGYSELIDFRTQDGICEGTGSLVFDQEQRLAYAVLSPRTDENITKFICARLGYEPIFLKAYANGKPIYHTNVLMCSAPEFTLICLDALDTESRAHFLRAHPKTKSLIEITASQMNQFAGNMLSVDCESGKFIILSETAFAALNEAQLAAISRHRKMVHFPISHIEKIGGGSARCMLAELF